MVWWCGVVLGDYNTTLDNSALGLISLGCGNWPSGPKNVVATAHSRKMTFLAIILFVEIIFAKHFIIQTEGEKLDILNIIISINSERFCQQRVWG